MLIDQIRDLTPREAAGIVSMPYTKKIQLPVAEPYLIDWMAFREAYPGVRFRTRKLPQRKADGSPDKQVSWWVLMDENGPDNPVFEERAEIELPQNFDGDAFALEHGLPTNPIKRRHTEIGGKLVYPKRLGPNPTIPPPIPRIRITRKVHELSDEVEHRVIALKKAPTQAEMDQVKTDLGAESVERIS